ncbi:DUF5324 family protein [Streptacidiphilus sp. N1-3]|uniref:DUF5324 family protein n=1 Tax=Streptacidiphilus alkalitolerans TaxID=3342712 RepID=A0ABV6WZC8_9ACTN
MTRIDAAREAAGKTREQLAPYAVSARDAAAHYTDEAWQRLAPHVEAAVEQARLAAHTAQSAAQSTVDNRVTPRVAPLWDQARSNVPPSVEDAVSKAAVRTRRAAKQARKAAVPVVTHAFDEAAQATAQAAHAARERGAAALPVLRGQVSLAEIEALAARHTRRRRSRWTRRVLVVGTLAAATVGGVAAWRWWQQQSNPDWLVEETPVSTLPPRSTPATGSHPRTDADEAMPLDPEVRATEAGTPTDRKNGKD